MSDTSKVVRLPKNSKTKKRTKPKMSELPGFKRYMEDLKQSNVIYKETAVTVDENGEILEQKYKTVSKTKEDDFIKLYLNDIGYFHNLQPSQQELLYYFLKKMNYDNLIVINKTINEMIAKESGKALSTVKNALATYVEQGILIRKGRGVYVANPYLFGKGHFENIQKIRTELIYTEEGLKMKSYIEKGNDDE